jgi:hypothetical protein
MTDDVMVQCAAFLHRNANHGFFGTLGCLADGFRHFARLAGAVADAAFLVTHDNQGSEGETASAFDHFGDAVDGNELVGQLIAGFAVAFLFAFARAVIITAAAAAFAWFTCHIFAP